MGRSPGSRAATPGAALAVSGYAVVDDVEVVKLSIVREAQTRGTPRTGTCWSCGGFVVFAETSRGAEYVGSISFDGYCNDHEGRPADWAYRRSGVLWDDLPAHR